MYKAILRRLLGEPTDEDEDDSAPRSLLDASVLVGHGGGNAAADREVESVTEQAERLADADRE